MKPQKKEESEPEDNDSDDDDLDFGAMLHTKKTNKPQVKYEKKKAANFSDE